MFAATLSRNADKLTYTDKRIANILMSEKEIVKLTSDKVAEKAGCGQSTVIRFSQKLGYGSFKDLVLDLGKDNAAAATSRLDYGDELSETMLKIKNMYDLSLEDIVSANEETQIYEAVEMMSNADSILCYGIKSSYSMASLMYYRLIETGMPVFKSDNIQEAVAVVRSLKKNDVIFVVSLSGENKEVIPVLNIAKKREVKILSVTSTGMRDNTIRKMSDVGLRCGANEVHTRRFNLINRTAQLYLIDCIFILLWKRNEERFMKAIEEFSEELESHSLTDDGIFSL